MAKFGFTTGSCAAAAAKAAAYMLLSGREKSQITIQTPKGIDYTADILEICRLEKAVSCAVKKDGGDDPDITTGLLIYAKVSLNLEKTTGISIDGGAGVGRVTLPGLDQPVGSAAINHVPREMICREVKEVCALFDYHGALDVEIYVPDGELVGARTFNPRLGITGGISILGTSGIVEPMSNQALLDTIRVELNQRRAQGFSYVAVSPGNYGLDFMKEHYGYDLDKSVKCSNFIGNTIDMAIEIGFQKMLLTGHIGKLIKVAGGVMNTHSKEADCRMELLAACALKSGVDVKQVREILDCAATEAALEILKQTGKLQDTMNEAMGRICYYLDKRAGGHLQIDCIMYANGFGELAKSKEASAWFTLLAQEQAQ